MMQGSKFSVLAFTTKVRGVKPGRNRRIFQGEKKKEILSMPTFGGEVKAVLSHVADFLARKRTLKVALTRYFQAKFTAHFSPNSSTFHC
jgi:hypothetical protein